VELVEEEAQKRKKEMDNNLRGSLSISPINFSCCPFFFHPTFSYTSVARGLFLLCTLLHDRGHGNIPKRNEEVAEKSNPGPFKERILDGLFYVFLIIDSLPFNTQPFGKLGDPSWVLPSISSTELKSQKGEAQLCGPWKFSPSTCFQEMEKKRGKSSEREKERSEKVDVSIYST
jgi:hypothetical protein